jgi:competence protein ComEC
MEMIRPRTRREAARLVRVPLVPAAVAVILGLTAGRYAPLGEAAWAVWAGVGLLAAVAGLALRRAPLAMAGALAAVLALSAVHFRLAYFRVSDNHIAAYVGARYEPATVRGFVAEAPTIQHFDAAMEWPRDPRTTFPLEVEAIHTAEGWRQAEGLVGVSVGEPETRLVRGSRVELVGRLRRIAGPSNPGQYDRAAAGRRTGKVVDLDVPGVDGVTPLDGGRSASPWAFRDRAGAWASGLFRAHAPGRAGMLVDALIVGRRDPGLREVNETMKRSGIAHLLSISGTHLAIFVGFIYVVCRLFLLGPRRAAAAALASLGGYLLLAEASSPLMRSAIMAAMVCAGVIVYRPGAALNALALAAIVLLAAEPTELLSAGFQLSFGTVAGLLVLTRPVKDLLFGRWLRRRGLMVFRGRSRLVRWWYFVVADWGMNTAAAATVAFAVSSPLMACHFGLFSPWGALLTVAVSPLVAAIVVPGYLALALAGAPNLSGLLATAAGRMSELLLWLNDQTRHLPALFFDLRPVGAGWALLCYAALLAVVFCRRIPWGRTLAAGLVLSAAGATYWTQRPSAPPPAAELHLLAVGAGQCALLHTPGNRTCLFDAGSLGNASTGEETLVPLVKARRLPWPREAFVSHANTDHYNALPALLDRGWLRTVNLNGQFGRDEPSGSAVAAAAFLDACRRRGAQIRRVQAGQSIRLDDRTEVRVLWPPADRTDLAINDSSLVLRIACDGRGVLLPGDIEQAAQRALLDTSRDALACDVLVLPHHGSWEPTLPELIAAARPRLVLVSSSKRPAAPLKAGPAGQGLFRSLGAQGKLLSTADSGWIRVRFGHGQFDVTTMKQGAADQEEE